MTSAWTVDSILKRLKPNSFSNLELSFCDKLTLIPIAETPTLVTVLVKDPTNEVLAFKLRLKANKPVCLLSCPETILLETLQELGSSQFFLQKLGQSLNAQSKSQAKQLAKSKGEDGNSSNQSLIVQLVDTIIGEAARVGASDIHIESGPQQAISKFRVDGSLRNSGISISAEHARALVNRIKILAELDISETRIPQDGRMVMEGNQGSHAANLDIRVSVMPSVNGESIVLRLLKSSLQTEKEAAKRKANSIADLGLNPETSDKLEGSLKFESGMFIMTGPTGSGKTTTLYALINHLNDGKAKIVTIEDPVEYVLPFAVQIAVDTKKKLSFATGLRSILRHDPDIIMVGEIRDKETAEIAVQAALTGHQVFATLHANSALDGLARLRHLGIAAVDIISAVKVFAAQRLVAKLCNSCQGAAKANCKTCLGLGVAGRLPLLEILPLDTKLRSAIEAGESLEGLMQLANQSGFSSLGQEATVAHKQGLISGQEKERFANVF